MTNPDPMTTVELRLAAIEKVASLVDDIVDDSPGKSLRLKACAEQALRHAVKLTRLARDGARAVDFLEHRILLELFLGQLDEYDRELWPSASASPAEFGAELAATALDMAYCYGHLVLNGTREFEDLPDHACPDRLPGPTETDPRVGKWLEGAVEGIQMRLPEPAEWPDWKIDTQHRAMRARLDSECQEALRLGGEPSGREPLRAETSSSTENELRPESGVWIVTFAGESARLEHRLGLEYIAYLLARPHRQIDVGELHDSVRSGRRADERLLPASEAHQEGLRITSGDAGLEKVDPETAAYAQRRLQRIAEEREALESHGLPTAELDAEVATIQEYLTAGQGKAGRPRTTGGTRDRLRRSVTQAIDRGIDYIGTEHETAAEHLRSFLDRGAKCLYRPQGAMNWRT